MAKKNTGKRKEINEEENIKLKNIIIVILVVLIFLGIFYLITVKVTKKDDSTSEEDTETYISSEEILVGSSFNRAGSEYLVVYYDKSNNDNSAISSKVYTYRNKDERIPLYEADMSNIFNKEYATEEEVNKEPKNIDELMINGPTLIKFSDDKVVEYIEGIDNILNYLG